MIKIPYVSIEAFRDALRAGIAVASEDTSRPHLSGVLFEVELVAGDSILHVVASDGHVLVAHGIPGVEVHAETEPFLLSRADALTLSGRLKLWSIGQAVCLAIDTAARTIRIEPDGFGMFYERVDEQPLPWRKVVPAYADAPLPRNWIGFSTRYVAVLDEVFAGQHVKASFGPTELDPVLFESTSKPVRFVVMPARIV